MSKEIQANMFCGLFKRHLNGNKQAQLRVVECKSVNWEQKTMDAVDNDGLKFYGISLGFGSLCVKPAIGSLCVVGLLEGQDTVTWLLHAEKADEIVWNGGKVAMKMNDRFMVKNDSDNLHDLLADLLTAIKAMKFTTNVGPTVELMNLLDFVKIENRIEKLLTNE